MLLNRQYGTVYNKEMVQLFVELYFQQEKNVRSDLILPLTTKTIPRLQHFENQAI